MTKWAPLVDFDEQQLQMQPDCDTTFAYYGRNITTLPSSNSDENTEDFLPPRNDVLFRDQEIKLVQKIKTTMCGDSLIGRRLTNDELEDTDTREYEIISMIRQAGMGPSIDEGLSSSRTIPAIVSDMRHTTRDFPVLFDDNYFKLKPRKTSGQKSSDSDTASTPNSSFSDGKEKVKSPTKKTSNSTKKSNQHSSVEIRKKSSVVAENEKILKSSRLTDHLSPPKNNVAKPVKDCSSSVPVPLENANTPIVQIPDTHVSKRTKCRIAANFGALDAQTNAPAKNKVPVGNSDVLRSIRSALVFMTPAELYRKKRQASSEITVK